MTEIDAQTLTTLKKVADGAARNQFHGNSLKSLCMRGLIKRIWIVENGSPRIRYYRLTRTGWKTLRASGQ